MIRHEMCLMKHDHKRGDNMIKKMTKIYSLPTLVMEDEELIIELLYRSFKYKNERRFNKETPKVNQKSTNKMVSQRYQNISMKRSVKKTALYCGKVKF